MYCRYVVLIVFSDTWNWRPGRKNAIKRRKEQKKKERGNCENWEGEKKVSVRKGRGNTKRITAN